MDEELNQDGFLDSNMLSSPTVIASHLSADLPSDLVSLPSSISVPVSAIAKSSHVHNKPQYLANWGNIDFYYCNYCHVQGCRKQYLIGQAK